MLFWDGNPKWPYSDKTESDLLKVSKFWKQIHWFSFEPKNECDYFLISAWYGIYGLLILN